MRTELAATKANLIDVDAGPAATAPSPKNIWLPLYKKKTKTEDEADFFFLASVYTLAARLHWPIEAQLGVALFLLRWTSRPNPLN